MGQRKALELLKQVARRQRTRLEQDAVQRMDSARFQIKEIARLGQNLVVMELK